MKHAPPGAVTGASGGFKAGQWRADRPGNPIAEPGGETPPYRLVGAPKTPRNR